MKKYLSIITAFLAITATGYASADEGFYVGVDGGGNWVSKSHRDFDAGWVVAGQIGYKFCNNFRFEGEVAYRKNEGRHGHHGSSNLTGTTYHREKGKLRTWSYMAHLLYDFDGWFDCWCITPYAGVGIGYANQRFERGHHGSNLGSTSSNSAYSSGHHRKNDNGFAWDILAGVSYPVTCNVDLDIHYHFLQGQRSINNNSVEAGLRYYF